MMKLKSALGFAMAAFAAMNMFAATETAKTSTPAGWTDDFDAAKSQAAKEKKLILADFSGSDWCGWCMKLDEEVFSKKEFMSEATNKYVLLMIDSPRDKTLLSQKASEQNRELVRWYGVKGYPTVLVMNCKGEVLYKTGYRAGGPVAYLKELEAQLAKEEARKAKEREAKAEEREAERAELERQLAELAALAAETRQKRAEEESHAATKSAGRAQLRPGRGELARRAANSSQVPVRPQPQNERPAKDAMSFNWENAPSGLLLDAYCERVGKTPIIDPDCPKRVTITLKSPEDQKLTNEKYLAAIRTALEMNGLYLENYGDDFILVLPRRDACKRGIPIIMDLGAARLGNGMNLVSVMIPFENISAEDAQKVLEGSKSSEGQLVVFAHTNRILVTDAERNVKRMLELAKAIDVASPVTEESFVRQIKYASATDIKAVLDQIVRDSQKPQTAQNNRPLAPASFARGRNTRSPQSTEDNASILFDISDADRGIIRGRVTIAAEEHANKLVIVASKANMDFFDKVIEQLDVKPLRTEVKALDCNKELEK